MKSITKKRSLGIALAMVLLALPVVGQIYRYYHPGTVWTVTTIRIHSGMDPAYLQYLDGAFKNFYYNRTIRTDFIFLNDR